jgi:hypothetical protein
MVTALERDALYYPYIEVQSANWLKSTLLCFPHVRRIVPGGYWPNDKRSIRPFCDTEGVGGLPLLINEYPDGEASSAEQVRLAHKIKANGEEFRRHFSQHATRRKYPTSANKYRIYYLKIDHRLRQCLVELKLAWEDEPGWFSLHPRLGRAVMATIAIAVANDRGFDIVTSDNMVHRSVCTQRQADVFDELTGFLRHEPAQASQELVNELACVFMTTYFDVSKLSIEQIVELQSDGKDLRRFKDAILPIAQRIPDISDLRERKRRLKESAAEINNEWKKYKKSLPRFAAEAIFDATEAKLPAAVSAALGAVTYLPLGVAAGIAVGFSSYAGWRMWQKYKKSTDSPYQFLNRVHRNGATLLVPSSVTASR